MLSLLSKAAHLDMKGENRDVNVVEWANISKFLILLNGD